MAKEFFSFPESMMMQIIEVLQEGLRTSIVDPEVEEMIDDWCLDKEEFARQMDRRVS